MVPVLWHAAARLQPHCPAQGEQHSENKGIPIAAAAPRLAGRFFNVKVESYRVFGNNTVQA